MKDPQKQKVYQAEWSHSTYRGRQDFRTIGAIESWANKVVGSRWFGKLFPHMAHSPVTFSKEESTGATAYAVKNLIEISNRCHRKIIVCHELAHLCNVDSEQFQINRVVGGLGRSKKRIVASHGKKFAGIYLKIVEKAMGKDAARELRDNFNALGVKYDKISVQLTRRAA